MMFFIMIFLVRLARWIPDRVAAAEVLLQRHGEAPDSSKPPPSLPHRFRQRIAPCDRTVNRKIRHALRVPAGRRNFLGIAKWMGRLAGKQAALSFGLLTPP
jgi:hypothetical protein